MGAATPKSGRNRLENGMNFVITVGADLNVWVLAQSNRGEHFLQLRLDILGQGGHSLGDIYALEKFLRVNCTAPHIIAVNVHHVTASDFQTCAIVYTKA